MSTTIAITGSTGLIGTALGRALESRGDTLVRLVRRPARDPSERTWDPATEWIDPHGLAGVDVVVNLAGAGVGDKRWTTEHKRDILTSRVSGTRTLVDAILATGSHARLVNGSAVGYYGDRGEEILTEGSPPGLGFLSEVVRAWEAAADPLHAAGRPAAFARTGIVASGYGGALGPLIRLTRFGLAGPIGSGRMFWPIISLPDAVAALVFLIDRPEISGPVNVVGGEPVRQRELMRLLGKALHRPSITPAPRLAVRAVLGEFANDVTASQRVQPEALHDHGFVHRHPSPAAVVAAALAER